MIPLDKVSSLKFESVFYSYFDKIILCYYSYKTNTVYNVSLDEYDYNEKTLDEIGIWKLKQLK